MKIAMIGIKGIPATYGGTEKIIEEIALELVQRGHYVAVYCRSHYSLKFHKEYKGIKLIHIPTIHTKHLDMIFHSFFSTIHSLFQNYDVIHFNNLGSAIFSWIPRLAGRKTLVQVHGAEWTDDKWNRLDKLIIKLFEYIAVFSPNVFTTVSSPWIDYYKNKFHIDVKYLSSATRFFNLMKAKKIREKWGLREKNYILFVSRLVPQKGCHHLIKAFGELQTNLKLAIAGGTDDTGGYVANLKNMALNNGRIVFLDWVYGDELKELFSNAYIYVHPSEAEGLSVSLLQALGVGTCVLASDIPENMDALRFYGYTFRNKDYVDLRNGMQKLIDHPELVEEKRGIAMKYVRERYGIKAVVDTLEKLYKSMVE